MEIRPLKTDEEIAQAIKEEWGDYESYRKAQFEYQRPPIPTVPEAVRKSAAEICLEAYEPAAEVQHLTLAEFFERHPAQYREYCHVATVRNY